MSLYRLYRPQTFDDVTGQDHVVDTLSEAVKQDKLAHAYLFAGTRGTGKTSVARILAKSILTRGITDDVLKKNILRAVDDGSLVDLTEIDAASNRGIDDIRSLLEKIQFTPVVASAKVYIIDEVHMLTREAFNALLKTLEEPPSYAYFILATTELHKIPPTIQSRCQRFLFKQISDDDIVSRLQFICKSESIDADTDALRAIAHAGGGSMRDAISLLDQLRSLENITLQDVKERIGEKGFEFAEQILLSLSNGDRNAIISIIAAMEERAVPMETFTRLLLALTRDELHDTIEAGKDAAIALRRLDVLMDAIKDLRIAPVPGLVLESALLSLIDSAVASPETKRPPAQKSATPAKPAVTPKEAPVETAPPMKTAAHVSLAELQRAWPDIVEKAEPPFVRMSLKNGHLHAVEGSTVIVRFGSAFHRDKASSAEGGRSVEEALREQFQTPLKVKYVLEADVAPVALLQDDSSVDLANAASEVF